VVVDRVATVSANHVRRLVWKIGVHVGGTMLEDGRCNDEEEEGR